MAIQITHPFVSAKGDGGDATLVRPSNWNANHSTSMADGNLVGRLSSGAGAFEEIPISALVAAALDEATGLAFLEALGVGGFETGDVKFSINPTASAGWIAYNGEGTISKAGAGGSVLASAAAQPLYEIIYDNISDTYCPVSGGRTGVAANDFAAGKTLGLPRFSGRTIIGAGTGSGLTARAAGAYDGAQTVFLAANQIPSLTSSGVNAITVVSNVNGIASNLAFGSSAAGAQSSPVWIGLASLTAITSNGNNNITVNYTNAGQQAVNNMQPYIPLWAKVKL